MKSEKTTMNATAAATAARPAAFRVAIPVKGPCRR
jgi:hypothetical protein